MLQINVHDKNFKLDDLIQAAKRGEEVVIITDEQERFKLVPLIPANPHPQYGSAEGLFEMADDFDTPDNQSNVPEKRYRKLGTAQGMFSMSDDFNEPLDDFKD